jgi:hypothetical protein
MRKLLFILIPLLLAIGLSAVEFDISGEYRARVARRDDALQNDETLFDNRLSLGLDTQFLENLKLRLATEISDTQWSKDGRGGIGVGKYIRITEAYLDYLIPGIDTRARAGQLYWKDQMSFIMDDYFPGAILSNDFGDHFHTELIWMNLSENKDSAHDEGNAFVLHARTDKPSPIGAYLIYGDYPEPDIQNITLMPYVSLGMGVLSLDAAAYVGKQNKGMNDLALGLVAKAKLDVNAFELGLDYLAGSTDSHTTISSRYQNGLYINGNGKYHDGLNLYWDNFFKNENIDIFTSTVLNTKIPLGQNLKFFAAAGAQVLFKIDENWTWGNSVVKANVGLEVNAGFEGIVIPDLLHIQVYGAISDAAKDEIFVFGEEVPGTEFKNYAVGSTLQIRF